jgi:hypothetical protein
VRFYAVFPLGHGAPAHYEGVVSPVLLAGMDELSEAERTSMLESSVALAGTLYVLVSQVMLCSALR